MRDMQVYGAGHSVVEPPAISHHSVYQMLFTGFKQMSAAMIRIVFHCSAFYRRNMTSYVHEAWLVALLRITADGNRLKSMGNAAGGSQQQYRSDNKNARSPNSKNQLL